MAGSFWSNVPEWWTVQKSFHGNCCFQIIEQWSLRVFLFLLVVVVGGVTVNNFLRAEKNASFFGFIFSTLAKVLTYWFINFPPLSSFSFALICHLRLAVRYHDSLMFMVNHYQ